MSDQGINDERRALRTTNENMMLMMYCTNPGDRLDNDQPMDETTKKSTPTTSKKRKMSSSSKRSARSQSSENRQRRLAHKEGESHLTHAPSFLISTNEKSQPRAIEWLCAIHTDFGVHRQTDVLSNFIVNNRMKSRPGARSSFSG